MSDFAYKNLTSPQNTESGIGDFALLAPVRDFEEGGIMCPRAPFNNPGDRAKIKDPHVFRSGKAFAKYSLAPEKNKLDAKTIGDKGFNKLDQELEIFIPGSYAEVHESMAQWLNTPLIALVKDADCGADMYYQLGCDCVYAYLTCDFSTGTTKDGQKGYNAKVSYPGKILLYVAGDPEVLADSSSSNS